MAGRAHRCAALALVGLLVPSGAAWGQDQLDLSVEPEDVDQPSGPLLDLSEQHPGMAPAEAQAPGWSVRPEVELDLEHDDSGDGALGTIEPELESLGMRLKRTW